MKPPALRPMSNHEVEKRAIAYVINYEKSTGRRAEDVSHTAGSPVDIESFDADGAKRLIEVKAFGGTGRGDDLWLEPNQVTALSEDPDSHIYVVTDVRSADPSAIRILDLTGARLRARLEAKREKRYYEVPLPTADYDDLHGRAIAPPTVTGSEFILQILEAVMALHMRGYRRIRFVTLCAPNGLSVRMFVGLDTDLPGGHPRQEVLDRIAHTSLGDAEEPAREFAGTMIPAWWSAEMIADQILTALPPVEPTSDGLEYTARLYKLFTQHRGNGSLALTDPEVD